ncbi:hypothetical protein Nepgr_024100 [Nepenthes gracilis]|uniref:Secreted protein n=1 Tax=Nepenthes gracilis TaxID=150966 RepID=A0AAD3XYA6_NEPGR|nr:hypothetical protein Nepgr_024100 [Nepenthes gracilis]
MLPRCAFAVFLVCFLFFLTEVSSARDEECYACGLEHGWFLYPVEGKRTLIAAGSHLVMLLMLHYYDVGAVGDAGGGSWLPTDFCVCCLCGVVF